MRCCSRRPLATGHRQQRQRRAGGRRLGQRRARYAIGKTANRLGRAAGKTTDGVGGGVAHHTRQIFLHVPAHVVDQPGHLGRQLHVALHVDLRLVARHHTLRNGQRRMLGQRHGEFGQRAVRRALQQTGGGGGQREMEVAPLHAHRLALLPLQAFLRGGFLHQHMVEKNHQPILHFAHHPLRWMQLAQQRLQEVARGGDAVCARASGVVRRVCVHDLRF